VSNIDNLDFAPMLDAESSVSVASLGLQLRVAREARGMSIDDVVHALKFSSRQIEAVEADNLDVLPGNVFLRGLVRSYARLLKLDPEPLIALAAASGSAQEPEIRAPENMGNAAPRGAFHQISPLVALSILLLSVAVAMIGWHYLGGSISMPQMLMERARSTVENLKPVDSANQPAAPVAVEPVVTPPVVTVTSEPVVVAATAPELPPAADSVTPVVPPGGRSLSFNFQGESWIEVKDASGLVILTGIYSSGNHTAAGRAPFEVVIGNASVVTMRDEGRAVNLAPYTRSEVARLTLE
jgi:cytoskeleton protein RodZ